MTNIKRIKVIFMGTPEFSVPILNALIANYQVVAVVTQPDKRVGRKQILTPSPIKLLAVENKIPVYQPEKIKNNGRFLNEIKELDPDLIVVASYGFILSKELLEIPKYGVINVHASLLPKYRGPSPIQAAILNGEDKTGVTIMMIEEKMDAGDILSKAEAEIAEDETFSSLHDKLSVLGTHLLIDTLLKYIKGEIKPQKQDDKKATYCKIITKEDGKINWSKSAQEIEQQVRALNPWPGTWTNWDEKSLKVIKAKVYKIAKGNNAGEVFKLNEGLAVYCGQDALGILELQLEGKKPIPIKEFLNGFSNFDGARLS